jgi:prolyl oligopeptidase
MQMISCVRSLLIISVLFCVTVNVTSADDPPAFVPNYPDAERVDHVDVYHGMKVADPYRWLEDDVRESEQVAQWVEDENVLTNAYLNSIPERDAIEERLTELWNYARYSTPSKKGGRYFFTMNDGLKNQSILYTMTSLEDEPEVLLDPNTWSEDGAVALSGTAVSEDGRYMAYRVSEAGSDWANWRIIEIETREELPELLRWIKFGGATWTHDSKGFFYMRFEEPGEGAEFQDLNLNNKVYYHRIGTEQSEDRLVYFQPEHPDWSYSPVVTEDGRYLVLHIGVGTDDRNRVVVMDLERPDAVPVELIKNFENAFSLIGNDGETLYFRTDLDAPLRRVIAIELNRESPDEVREIIPEAEESLAGVDLVGGRFVTRYLKDVLPLVRIYSIEGEAIRDVSFEGIGSISGFSGRSDDSETFYSFSGYNIPPSIYRYDVETDETELFRQAETPFDGEQYEVKQVFVESKDGTKIPMCIVHRKGIELTGDHPTLLYGYGGFAISILPRYSTSVASWLEMGGIYAVANMRGGDEYGEAWHKAGTKNQKQNVFDDFIASAEWLIENGYTRSDKLAIHGRSNGGLLVGAVMTQRPNLFGACLPGVGVMDMLRFQCFTAGRYWTDDYGSSDNADEFPALYAYSPYHNIEEDVAYPPTMVTTADRDDRVVPGHSFKFAAAMQHAQSGDNPILIRIETRAGHGAGKPTSKQIVEIADQWAFLVRTLGMDID